MSQNINNWFEWPSSPHDQPTAAEMAIINRCAELCAAGKPDDALILTLSFSADRHQSFPCLLTQCECAMQSGEYRVVKNSASQILIENDFLGAWTLLVYSLFKLGESREAMNICEMAQARYPQSPFPILTKAQITATDDPELAWVLFREAIRIVQTDQSKTDTERQRAAGVIIREALREPDFANIGERVGALCFLHHHTKE